MFEMGLLVFFLERCAEYFDEIPILSVQNGPVNSKLLKIFEKCNEVVILCGFL